MFRVDVRSGPARRTLRLGVCASALTLGLLGWATPASAHVDVTPSTTAAGGYTILTFSVGHGCEDSPTTKITIQIPAGISSVTPTRNPLWEVEKEAETLDPPLADSHGNEITERIASVTYTAITPLPDGYRDTFELSLRLPETEGEAIAFPTIQTCEKGESAWIEVAQDGQDGDELGLPAPSFVLTEASEGDHHGAATTTSDADHDEKAGSDEGGSAMAPTALAAGLLGAVLGGAALVRQRRRA